MKQPIILPEFIWEDNLEFVFTQWEQDISKVLYRSFWDPEIFRKKILDFFMYSDFLEVWWKKMIQDIFSLESLKESVFHFWVDGATKRYKFYISLYHYDFETALKILSEIKDILWISQEYFLEENFIKFDSLGFDIKDGKIELKVYELLQRADEYFPSNVFAKNIKEYGVLKTLWWRKKYFYRFEDYFHINDFPDLRKNNIWELQDYFDWYSIQKKIKYYCFEWNKKEMYFV